MQSKIFHYSGTDEYLSSFYKFASLFICPSLYEGFGFSTIEAMSLGCPTLLTNRSSIPEIGGKNGDYFDPENNVDFIAKTNELLNNKEHRIKNIQNGKDNSKRFTWEKSYQETRNVYEKVLG